MDKIQLLRKATALAVTTALVGQSALTPALADTEKNHGKTTRTPIDHLIVIIGENHTFDNLFGGYKPTKGQKIWNLLSEGII